MKTVSLAKITRPKLSGAVKRDRLFRLLDQGRQKPVVWVAAQGGSGKTTLVADWLDSRKLPCLWYQVDEGDGDIASFFYYMGMAAKNAAPRYKKSLPILTPEYLPGIPVFTRRYFEDLFSRLKSPSVVVLDNYQDAPLASGFHDMLAHGLDAIPEGITVAILSRAAPPPQLARLQANNRLHTIGWEDVRFTREESLGLLETQGHGKQSPEALEMLLGKTEGWAAGLILLTAGAGMAASEPYADMTAGKLFDYFASEIFSKTDGPVQDILLKTSFLQKIEPALAEQLTGNTMTAHVLERMSRNHYFTQKYGQAYQYHPLFREFLQSRAKTIFSHLDIVSIQQQAAELLEQAGSVEEAAGLYIDVADWNGVQRLIGEHASHFMTQGRSCIVMEWLNHLPPEVLNADGWLLYWSGLCRLAMQPGMSRKDFERAYIRFEERDDPVGLYLSWAGILDTYVFEWGDFRPIDRWITALESLQARHPVFPSAEIEVRVAGGMFNALVWRQPWHPSLAAWEARVMSLVFSPDVPLPLRTMLGSPVALYHIWMGDIAKVEVVIEATRSTVADPLTRLNWYVMAAMHAWFAAEHDKCLALIAEGLRLAEETGVHLLDIYLSAQAIYSSVAANQLAAAEEHLRRIAQHPIQRLMDKSLFYYQSASVAWLRNDLLRANEYSRIAIDMAEQTGAALPEALCRIEFASTLFDQGSFDEGNGQLEHALALGHGISPGNFDRSLASGKGMNLISFMGRIAEAKGALHLGETARAVEMLRNALADGARQGYVNFPRWHAPTMSRLCALALEHDIESDYVKKLIKVRNLAPPESAANLDAWPWPIRIFTLGRFEIVRDGKPVEFSGKVQQKPLELLKALIALGGADVGYEQLSAALWPDAEGDKAYHSLGVALHRLRKLLGDETAIQRQGNRVSLNPQCCWCDTLAFEQAVEEALNLRCSSEMSLRLSERAVGLYQGSFLGDLEKTWGIAPRERLSNKYVRLVKKTAGALERSGQLEHAIEHYHKALDVNQIAEEFYQGLMDCYHRLGRKAEAISAYNQCRRVLSAAIGVPPSARTESIYRTLIAASK